MKLFILVLLTVASAMARWEYISDDANVKDATSINKDNADVENNIAKRSANVYGPAITNKWCSNKIAKYAKNGAKKTCDGTRSDCFAKGKAICDQEPNCYGVMWHPGWSKERFGVMLCSGTKMDRKTDGWVTQMKPLPYVMIKTGKCADTGMAPIHTESECYTAADQLNLSYKTFSNALHGSIKSAIGTPRPEGCYYNGYLWMSKNALNVGNGADSSRWPLCKKVAAKKDTPAKVGLTPDEFEQKFHLSKDEEKAAESKGVFDQAVEELSK